MLRHEEAEKRLEKVKIKNWDDRALAAVGKLPTKLAAIGRGLFDRDASGKKVNWQKAYEVRKEAFKALGKLAPKDRLRIFEALFPRIAKHLEAGWQLLATLPYEIDYDRKGFRAPGEVDVHHASRQSWFQDIMSELGGYDQDLPWFAAWAPYLSEGSGADSAGILFAAAINAGGREGEDVFAILKESASNQHEIGRMGRHVSRALLVCSRPDAWEFMEKLLLAAQRQEGLRQVILESIDEAHPQAFRRMLALLLDQNLIRFSSVVRAVDVWFGLQWDALTPAKIKEALQTVRRFLEDKEARDEVLTNGLGEPLYLALWTLAFEDAPAAVKPAAALLEDDNVERRFVAAHFLNQIGLPAARKALVPALGDENLRIALTALEGCQGEDDTPPLSPLGRGVGGEGKGDLFDPLLKLLERMPSRRTVLPGLVWPWTAAIADRQEVADQLVDHIGKRSATVLIPHVGSMGYFGKRWLIDKLVSGKKKVEGAVRDLLFGLVADRDDDVREKALKALKKCTVEAEDAVRLEALLTRKSSEMRRGVLGLLLKQKQDAALASSDRLLASRKPGPRLAGLELLRELVDRKRGVPAARERAAKYRVDHPDLDEHENTQVDAILDIKRVVPVLDDALGLMSPDGRSPVVPPKRRKVTFITPAACALLKNLDDFIHQHRDASIIVEDYDGPEEMLLADVGYGFPEPDWDTPIDRDRKRLPLPELWDEWWRQRPKDTRDRDGKELLRAAYWQGIEKDTLKYWQRYAQRSPGLKAAIESLTGGQGPVKLRYDAVVNQLLGWLRRLHPPEGEVDFLLDAVETAFALVPADELERERNPKNKEGGWRRLPPFVKWADELRARWARPREPWTREQTVRYWQLLHWHDQPVAGVSRSRPDWNLLLAAFDAGAATQNDLLDDLLGPRGEDNEYWSDYEFASLKILTGLNPPEIVGRRPELQQLLERCRERLLEIELARGELPTNATAPARDLGALFGLDTLARLLQALGGKPFDRKDASSESKGAVLTRLLNRTHPRPPDTPEAFADRMKELIEKKVLTSERVLELGFLAPQWLNHVERFFGWEGLKEGVWWFLAHTPSGRNGLDGTDEYESFDDDDDDDDLEDGDSEVETQADQKQQPEDPWTKLLRERTPLTQGQMRKGAVDVGWFARTYGVVGGKRWQLLAEASKCGCSDNGYKKAVLLGEVLRGKASRGELVEGVKVRRLKESVRLLGLLPLPAGEKRETELLARYKVLQEYRRYARGLSPMSREGSVRTAEIGLENLARTAGYPDPIRLEWAMEAREIADLAKGPISATNQGVTVTLALDEQAQAVLTVQRGNKPLKNIPADVRKYPKIAYLTERKADLKRQASRMRQSLETAMCRGDTFTGSELKKLFEHPVLVRLLERLVLLGEGIRGYPVAGGQGLSDHAGKVEPIKSDEKLRLAHPHDLLTAGDWPAWQKHCFAVERVQPFKQVFRELYVVTEQEKSDSTVSHRYTAHQVNPGQALALLGSRGWSTRDEVSKTFYDLGLVAELTFRSGAFTPLEVEGLTLEDVRFTRRGEFKPMPLVEVPPRVFSEVMRDLDLVVSVAHVGGVDPEASASTVDMRAALLHETCALLRIGNVRVQTPHVLIDGQLGRYSVHLGSAVVHRQPGGALCIVPVHAQQRGRLFLPFADDDPRTAEVLSKVILLARDQEIQDPNILDQLRS